jgi:hypothetical protein
VTPAVLLARRIPPVVLARRRAGCSADLHEAALVVDNALTVLGGRQPLTAVGV